MPEMTVLSSAALSATAWVARLSSCRAQLSIAMAIICAFKDPALEQLAPIEPDTGTNQVAFDCSRNSLCYTTQLSAECGLISTGGRTSLLEELSKRLLVAGHQTGV